LKVWEKHWSEPVAKQAVWLSGLLPYEQVAEVMERLAGVAISTSSVWRLVQRWGAAMQAVESRQQQKAYELHEPDPVDPNHSLPPMGVAMDGSMVHIREEGWKELKVGTVFEVGTRDVTDPDTQERVTVGAAQQTTYVAHLGRPEPFGRQIWAEARQRQWLHAQDSLAIGDGAPWIWNLVAEHFPHSHQLVDWFHASEHLADIARQVYGEGTAKAQRWYRRWKARLYQGHGRRLVQALKQLARAHQSLGDFLRQQAGYFQSHLKRMNYLEMRMEGYPLGSGMVESAAKQFKARFCGSGMRWSRTGAQRLLPIRSALLSHRFDRTWRLAYNSPQN
jgi:hypothetical protein